MKHVVKNHWKGGGVFLKRTLLEMRFLKRSITERAAQIASIFQSLSFIITF